MIAQSASLLSEEELLSYRVNGFLGVPQIADAGEVAHLREILTDLFDRNAGRLYGDSFDVAGVDAEPDAVAAIPQMWHPSRYAPSLFGLPVREAGLEIAKQLLGPEAKFDHDHAIFKRPGNGAATRWHQDEAYWDGRYDHEAISIWVSLQDVGVDGGCMEFVPGSHLGPVRMHQSIDNDPRIHGLECKDLDGRFRVVHPLPAGGATIHHPRTLHSTGPNNTLVPRYAYILVYQVPPKLRETERNHVWMAGKNVAREGRFNASRSGKDGLLNRGLRRASLIVQAANEWNERRSFSRRRASP